MVTSNITEQIKPKDIDPKLIKRLEDKYGPVDMVNDFFTNDLKTYYKTDGVNKETNSISHKVIKLASFGDSLQKMYSALKALKQLLATDDARNDEVIQKILVDFREVFNRYRTHLRTSYPDQYRQIKNQLKEIEIDEISTSGGAGAYQTPFAFRLKGQKANDKAYKELGYEEVEEGIGAHLGPGPTASEDGVKDNAYVKQFKYKLVPKDKQGNYVQKGSGLEVKNLFKEEAGQTPKQFHQERMSGFDRVGDLLGQINPLLNDAKRETEEFYKETPESYDVVYGTDLVVDYLNDILDILKDKEE
tara:strand:+ start:1705 stop:2613 length:909 start_codon:yes stop_codon:yes gene_type:complete